MCTNDVLIETLQTRMSQRADAQKGIMKVIEKIVETIKGGSFEQQYKRDTRLLLQRHSQNSRILGDFPWLWAVRHSWELATDSVQVTDSKSFCLSVKISEEMKHHHQRIPELWAHLSKKINGRPLEWVEQVWGGEINKDILVTKPEITWDELLCAYHQRADFTTVHHVVVVQNTPDSIYVIRPQKPFKTFNDIWAWRSWCN